MPNDRPGPTLAESRPDQPRRARRRGPITLLVILLLVGGGGWLGARFLYDSVRTPRCVVTAGGVTESFDPEQTSNAAIITAISMKRGLPPRAATIALTTAFQESKILNIKYGDRDSLGLFQQRPSQGWGTPEQILDPVYSSGKFYDALVKVKGYETADITKIAQKVQRSAFPEAYRDHEGQGRVLASALTGNSPAGLSCRLDEATTRATPSLVVADLAEQMGIAATSGQLGVTIKAPDTLRAWAVAHWAVARAELYGATSVTVGERVWKRASGDDGWSEGSDGITVTVTLR